MTTTIYLHLTTVGEEVAVAKIQVLMAQAPPADPEAPAAGPAAPRPPPRPPDAADRRCPGRAAGGGAWVMPNPRRLRPKRRPRNRGPRWARSSGSTARPIAGPTPAN